VSKRKIRSRETLYLAAYATPASQELAGSEALLSIADIDLALRNAGGWHMPVVEGPGDAEMFGDLVAFAFASDSAAALGRIDALLAWLELHAAVVAAAEIRIEVRDISEQMSSLPPEFSVVWHPERGGPSSRSNVVPFHARRA
jgi:hypothetical protein